MHKSSATSGHGAEPSPSIAEAQGEEAEEYAKAPPLVEDSPTKAPQALAQRIQQAHGPNIDMTQQPLAQPVESISQAQQFQVPAATVATPVQKRCSFVKQCMSSQWTQ